MTIVSEGIGMKCYAQIEGSYDEAPAVIAGADFVPAVELEITPSKDYHPSKAHLGTASLETEVEGMESGRWRMVLEVRTNAAGTVPPNDPLMVATVSADATGSGSKTYALAAVAPKSLLLVKQVGSGLQEVASGAWVEECTCELIGNDINKWTYTGGFARYGWVYGNPVSTATITAADTTFTLATGTPGQRLKIGKNARIKIGTDDNTSQGYLVTDVSAAGVVTFTPALANTQAGATTIYPFAPTPTVSGTISGGVGCGCTIDTAPASGSFSIGIISAKVTIKTGIHGLSKEATAYRPNRLARGKREVTIELNTYFLDTDMAPVMGQANRGALWSVVLRAGPDTTGLRMKITIPKIRFKVTPIQVPEAEEATAKIEGVARYNSAFEDEISFLYD